MKAAPLKFFILNNFMQDLIKRNSSKVLFYQIAEEIAKTVNSLDNENLVYLKKNILECITEPD